MQTPWAQKTIAELKSEIVRQKWGRHAPDYGMLPYESLEKIVNDLAVLCRGGLEFRTPDWQTGKVEPVKHCSLDNILDMSIEKALTNNCNGIRLMPIFDSEQQDKCEEISRVYLVGSSGEIYEYMDTLGMCHNPLSTALKFYANLNLMTRSFHQQGEFEWFLLPCPELKVRIKISVTPSSVLFIGESTENILVEFLTGLTDTELSRLLTAPRVF